MSLIAWFPLNGDTNDYSGNGVLATSSRATVDNNGKIGKCYNTAEVGYINIVPNIMSGLGDVSISIWVNVTSWHTSYSTIFALNSGSASWADNLISLLRDSTNARFVFAIGDDASESTTNSCSSDNLNLNTWVHFTCVYKCGEYIKLYTDGTLTSAYNTNIKVPFENGTSFRIGKNSGSSYQSDILVNDFRIYDHALSEKEVKEIAKAKILHYTFDDFQEPTENLLIGGDIPITSSSYGIKDYTFSKPMIEGETYTISLKGTLGEGKSYFGIYNSGGSVSFTTLSSANLDADGVYRRTFTGKVGTSANTYARVYHMPSSTVVDSTVEWVQIEKKDHATPFTPDTREGTAKDISGYNNHASLALATTPAWTEDSKIGRGAYRFDGTQHIDSKVNTTLPDITFSGWIKLTESSAWMIVDKATGGTSGSYYMYGGSSNDATWSLFSSTGARYNIALGAIGLNTWCHLVGTFDSVTGIAKAYKNGVLMGTTNALLGSNSSNILIGKYTSGYNVKGFIDDVRIYATALSEDDVKELYSTRMSLDNKGNVSVNKLELNPINGCPPFEHWTLGGGAYVENDELVLPNYGATAISPLIDIGANPNWYWSADYFSTSPKPGSTTEGGYLQGSSYYDIDGVPTLNASGYSSNGNAGSYPIGKWTKKIWSYVGGNKVRYLKINISSNSTYSARNSRIRNPMVTVNGITSDHMTYSSKEMTNSVPKYNINERGILSCNEIYEVGMPIRYIRESMNGSSANAGNHWVEIQAYNKHDVNVALGKSASSALLTDGITATSPYSITDSVQVDLGEVMIVSYLKIWHYYGDGRTYKNIKTEVSADGVNWIGLFDSNIDGEYAETPEGKTILLRPQSFSIGASGEIFTNELKEV